MSPEQANKLLAKAAHLRLQCNANPEATREMVNTAWDIRQKLAEFAEEVKPGIFNELPKPNAVEEDGFPATGNKVYHPVIDRCFHRLVGGANLYPTNLAGIMTGLIEAEL